MKNLKDDVNPPFTAVRMSLFSSKLLPPPQQTGLESDSRMRTPVEFGDINIGT